MLRERVAARAARTWAERAFFERIASARFERLAGRMANAGFHRVLVGGARQAAADEDRHAVLCERLARSLGARGVPSPPEPEEIAPRSLAPRQRVLYEVTAVCAISESINAALLSEVVRRARARAVRETARALLRDEIAHARLGWSTLALEPANGAAFLGRFIPAMLAGTVTEELFGDEEAELPGDLAAAGELALAERRRLFAGAMEQVVLPGLARSGVDVAPARRWLNNAVTTRPDPRHAHLRDDRGWLTR